MGVTGNFSNFGILMSLSDHRKEHKIAEIDHTLGKPIKKHTNLEKLDVLRKPVGISIALLVKLTKICLQM